MCLLDTFFWNVSACHLHWPKFNVIPIAIPLLYGRNRNTEDKTERTMARSYVAFHTIVDSEGDARGWKYYLKNSWCRNIASPQIRNNIKNTFFAINEPLWITCLLTTKTNTAPNTTLSYQFFFRFRFCTLFCEKRSWNDVERVLQKRRHASRTSYIAKFDVNQGLLVFAHLSES